MELKKSGLQMTQKTKLYISKSKAGDVAVINGIMATLRAYDVEILEFTGGTYNTDALLKADILLVIPPLPIDESGQTWVGKGQCLEISEFSTKCLGKPILIFQNFIEDFSISAKSLLIQEYESTAIHNIDWQTHYATIQTDGYASYISDYGLVTKSLVDFNGCRVSLPLEVPDSMCSIKTNHRKKAKLSCILLLK